MATSHFIIHGESLVLFLNFRSCKATEVDLTEINILFFESANIVLASSIIILIPREKGHFQRRENI